MTINKAREILGPVTFSDDEIQATIQSFDTLIEVGFQRFEVEYKEKLDRLKRS